METGQKHWWLTRHFIVATIKANLKHERQNENKDYEGETSEQMVTNNMTDWNLQI